MHNYIDINILRDFSKQYSFDDVYDELHDVYKITNATDEECFCYLVEALYDDLKYRRANFHSYIEYGMNARMMMELRKSAVMPFKDNMMPFYTGHYKCETPQEVKDYRCLYVHNVNSDYADLDWQYYYLILYSWRGQAKDFFFDFESCFDDCTEYKMTGYTEYRDQFVDAHTMKRADYIKKYHLEEYLARYNIT